MHMGHKTYGIVHMHGLKICKWAIEATMVWRTPANKTSRLSSVIVVSCCVQTNSPCHVKSMGIVPMHEWKGPLKYRGTLPFPSGSLGLGQAADTMVWGRVPMKWRE
jgi:hypothetical protein